MSVSGTIVSGTQIAPELLKALGLENQRVRSVVLRAAVGEPVSVIVEKYIGCDQAKEVVGIAKSYELVEKKQVGGAEPPNDP